MIKSVEKAIKIMRVLADADGDSLTLSEISLLTGYNKSTCVHILETLVNENMIEHISRSEGYSIGYGIFMMTRFGGFNHKLKEVTHPMLKWLTRKTNQTTAFYVLKEDKRIRIDCVLGELDFGNVVMRVEKLSMSSTSAVLIANLKSYSQHEILNNLPKTEIPDKTEIEKVKRQGFSETFYTLDNTDFRSFAVPVFKDKKCVGALAMIYKGERNDNFLKQMKKTANEISRRLDFAGHIQ